MTDTAVLAHTCRTCAYWGERTPLWNLLPLQTCGQPRILHGLFVEQAQAFPDAAVVEVQEGWGFLTGPEFGCVHWDARALTPPEEDAPDASPAA